MKIINYTAELEDRRIRFLEFINTSKEINLSQKARVNLESNVVNMEIKVLRRSDNIQNNLEKPKVMKCRYDNTGFCKYQGGCKYYHSGQVCEQHIKGGKCENGQGCLLRHPKDCKHWLGDFTRM